MDRLHIEDVSQDEGNTLTSAEVNKPVLGEDTFDTDNQIRSVGCNRLEKWFRTGGTVTVLTLLVQARVGGGFAARRCAWGVHHRSRSFP